MVVILMTGFTEDFSFDSAIDIGASDFLKKPLTAKELRLRIRQVELRGNYDACRLLMNLPVYTTAEVYLLWLTIILKWLKD